MAINDLITLETVKDFINADNSADDAVLLRLITRASSIVSNYCRYNFVVQQYVETYSPYRWSDTLLLRQYPVVSVIQVVLWQNANDSKTIIDGSHFDVTRDGQIKVSPNYTDTDYFPAGLATVQVTYTAGFPIIPDAVQTATAIVVKNMFAARKIDGIYQSQKAYDYSYTLKSSSTYISEEVQQLLMPYRRTIINTY